MKFILGNSNKVAAKKEVEAKTTAHPDEYASRVLEQADAARDSGEYSRAADLYQNYLQFDPDNFSILMQVGNCHKDAGEYEEAEIAYDKALQLNGTNADAYLQFGHLSKLAGQIDRAVDCYLRSYVLDPNSPHARKELRALGIDAARDVSLSSLRQNFERPTGTVYFVDIYDVIQYLRAHVRVTGIQRVVSGIILSQPKASNKADIVVYCMLNPGSGKIDVFDHEKLIRLIKYATSKWVNRKHLDDLLEDVVGTTKEAIIAAGDRYFIAGAFWSVPDSGSLLLRLKDQGVVVGAYIYDLIPITHPQFVTESTNQLVMERFTDILIVCDYFLTISEFVAHEVREILKNELQIEKPVQPVLLAHSLTDEGKSSAITSKDIRAIGLTEYVLCVCTLEGRKNHMLLVDVWQRLVRKYGFAKTPKLILVGKWGWRTRDLKKASDSELFRNGFIEIRNEVSDSDLAYLYEHCLFTVFPSFVEGWGLPVGESLSFGRPCAASNSSSIPEVGKDFVEYYSPYNPFEAFSVIEKLIMDKAHRNALAERIQREFKMRTWRDVADDLVKRLEEAKPSIVSSKAGDDLINISQAEFHSLSGDALSSNSTLSWRKKTVRLILGENWHHWESWGSWSSSSRPTLRVSAGTKASGQSFVLYIQLRAAKNTVGRAFKIRDGYGNFSSFVGLDENPVWVKASATANEKGVIQIVIDGGPEFNSPSANSEDIQRHFFGLSGFCYHVAGNLEIRMNVLEKFLELSGGQGGIILSPTPL